MASPMALSWSVLHLRRPQSSALGVLLNERPSTRTQGPALTPLSPLLYLNVPALLSARSLPPLVPGYPPVVADGRGQTGTETRRARAPLRWRATLRIY